MQSFTIEEFKKIHQAWKESELKNYMLNPLIYRVSHFMF